jgi:cell division protein FtsB
MSSYSHHVEVQPDLGPVAQLNRILPWIIGLAVLAMVLSRYLPQLSKNEELRKQLQRKTEQVQKLEADVNRLHAENNALQNDARTVERIAREQLSYARPDELVVTFQTAAVVGGARPLNTGANGTTPARPR